MSNFYKSQDVPSNRKFGLLFGGIFIFLAAYNGYLGSSEIAGYAWLIGGGVLGLIATFIPNVLTPFNKAWMYTGEVMGRVISPLVLGVIFFVLITPVALLTRIFGRDKLHLKKTDRETYWISRIPRGPTGESFNNQF